jgi:hypothetical protein
MQSGLISGIFYVIFLSITVEGKRMMKKIKIAAVLFLLISTGVFGYIDPGTGSYVIQIILAAIVGLSFGLKLFWRKIKGFFRNLFHRGDKEQGNE